MLVVDKKNTGRIKNEAVACLLKKKMVLILCLLSTSSWKASESLRGGCSWPKMAANGEAGNDRAWMKFESSLQEKCIIFSLLNLFFYNLSGLFVWFQISRKKNLFLKSLLTYDLTYVDAFLLYHFFTISGRSHHCPHIALWVSTDTTGVRLMGTAGHITTLLFSSWGLYLNIDED